MSLPVQDATAFEVVLPSSPYPGLRPFMKSEWPIFFGRERMVDEAISRLVRQHLLVVHGDSGCGKSSLIRAGVLARLEQEVARGGLVWRTCSAEPGEAPLHNLAESLAALDRRAEDEARIVEIRRVLNFGADAPSALMQMLHRGAADHVCILLDQFEELFAFSKRHGPAEARLLVQFLVGVLRRPLPGLYVVVTMRSEFLGACAQFPGLAEAVNDAQYLLPRMANSDLMRAIREPATLYGGHVSADLAQRLIADAGGTQDELPLIQHGLMALHRRKTWGDANDDRENLEGADAGGYRTWRLELADYTSGPALASMLSAHADAVAGKAEPPTGTLVEKLFRALTEINADGQAVRRPQTLGMLAAVTGASLATLESVIKPFRQPGASFIRPYGDDKLTADTRIDISHEALIRSWQKIADKERGWLAREFEDGLIWKSLLVQAGSFVKDRSNVLSASTARDREEWLRERNPAWAERYGGGWGHVEELVTASVAASRAAEEAEKARVRKQKMLFSTIVVLLVGSLAIFVWYSQQVRAALASTYVERAGTLWGRLDFSDRLRLRNTELNALWEVAAGRAEVREAFIEQLNTERERAVTLGKRPAPLMRAMFLRWPPERAEMALMSIIRAIGSTTDRVEVGALRTAMEDLAAELPAGRVAALSQTLSDGIERSTDSNQLEAFGEVLVAMAPGLTPERAQELFPVVMSAVTSKNDGDGLEEGLIALAERFTEAQADRVLPSFRAGIDRASDERADRLPKAANAVGARTSAARARAAFPETLDALMTAKGRPRQVMAELTKALAGKLPAETVPEAFSSLVTAISATTDNGPLLDGLGEAAKTTGQRMPQDQVLAAASPALTLLTRSEDGDQQTALKLALEGLAARLTPKDAQQALTRVIDEVPNIDDQGAAHDLGTIAGILAAKIDSGQRRAALTRIQSTMAAATNAIRVRMLALAFNELAPAAPPEQSASIVSRALTAMATGASANSLDALASVVEKTAPNLAPGQARVFLLRALSDIVRSPEARQVGPLAKAGMALAPKVAAADAGATLRPLLSAIQATKGSNALKSLEGAALLLVQKVNPVQAHGALPPVVAAIQRLDDADQLNALGSFGRALLGKTTPEQGRAALIPVSQSMATATEDRLAAFASIASSEVPRLDPERAQSLWPSMQKAMTATTEPGLLKAIGEGSAKIASTFPPMRASELLTETVDVLLKSDDADQQQAIGQAADALAAVLTPAQAQSALTALLKKMTPEIGDSQPEALGRVAQTLVGKLTSEQAKPHLDTARTSLEGETDRDAIEALGTVVIALAAKVEASQAQADLTAALKAMAPRSKSDPFVNRVRSLSSTWTSEQSRQSLISLIGWSGNAAEVMHWAPVLLERLPREPANTEQSVRTIVDALKFPTTTGAASDFLLDGLKTIAPSAPGKAGKLEGTFAWLEKTYPALARDFDSPPNCPAPPSPDLTCPVARR